MHSVFTSSWDDGHPNDVRVADLLTQYSLPGTFFIPTSNSEGMPVLNGIDLRSISEEFEIGSHTLSHIYLNSVEALEANRQIVEGKSRLEQDLGFQVHGFCYPGGKQNSAIRGMVEKAGFFYARGVTNLDTAPTDRFRMPTTIQFFPHPRKVFVKNYLTRGGLNRYPLLPVVLRHSSLKDQLSSAMRFVALNGGIFHLWGHSWELDNFNGWGLLNEVFAEAAELFPQETRLSNFDLACSLHGSASSIGCME